ncbi:MAG TPA: rhodanese-like domain-containing protein [Saprospiraceae bacterium]|nr:rhodanese-like domain-containing protein [Saprospiraceae bacterium]
MNLFKSELDEEIVSWIKDKAILIDVRSEKEFRTGYVAGSINIPLPELRKQINKLNRKDRFVIYCRSGNRSGAAIDLMKSHGFQYLKNGISWRLVDKALH